MASILIFTAVPFPLGRVQSVGRSAVRSCVEVTNVCDDRSRNDGRSSGKRKKRRLDYLSPEEKIHRRRLLCREAAQNARDSMKKRMSFLEKKLAQLKRERDVLLVENQSLKENHKHLEVENCNLLQASMESSTIVFLRQGECSSSEEALKADAQALTSSGIPGFVRSLEQAEGAGSSTNLCTDDVGCHNRASMRLLSTPEGRSSDQECDADNSSMYQQHNVWSGSHCSEFNVSASELSQELDMIESLIYEDQKNSENGQPSLYSVSSGFHVNEGSSAESNHLGSCKDKISNVLFETSNEIPSIGSSFMNKSFQCTTLCLQDLFDDLASDMDLSGSNEIF